MYPDILQLASDMHSREEAFVIATVVRCEPPTSGKPGDRAIIAANGKMAGWIGGGCAQPIVIQESLKSLLDGRPRLVRVSPTAGAEPAEGITGFTMMCHSGGTLDIFIEPMLPKTHVLIFGRSPVAKTLVSLAKVLSYRVSVIAPAESVQEFAAADIALSSYVEDSIRITPQTAIVVATQGEDDEGALEKALSLGAASVSFVASKKKWEAVFAFLQEKGLPADRLEKVRVPAGIDIGAKTPDEIAVSILAQIIQRRNEGIPAALPVIQPLQAKDPVCGMSVSAGTAKYVSEYLGEKIYFCCAHCQTSFEKDPAQFINR